MAEETAKPAKSSSSSSSAKSAPEAAPGLAPVQGEYLEHPRKPGSPEHLGENPYQGGPSPFVEGEA